MAQILYFLFIKPLSFFPLAVLYLLSDTLFLLSLVGISYRQKVVMHNLLKAFPKKSQKERRIIKRRFYRHFYDLLVESIKLFSISRNEAVRRFRVTNPEIFEALKNQRKSAILTGGHYQNWELFAVATAPQIGPKLLGIYTPLSNAFFEKKFSASRSKFGLILVPKKQVSAYFEAYKDKLTVCTFAVDQCPRKSQKIYWTDFLGQPTACHFGAEKYAREYDQAIIFGKAKKVKRGHYELTFELLHVDLQQSENGAMIEKSTRLLEEQIKEAPEYWLWTHKRWKLQPT